MPGVKGQRSGGANAKTPQAHKLQGTFQKVRHAGYQGPDAPKGTPTPPKPLEGEVKAEWDRMIERLTQTGAASTVDDGVLYQYCHLFAEVEALRSDQETARGSVQILEENIHGLEGPELVQVFQEIAKLRHDIKGYSTSIRQGRMAIRAYLQEFGLTPASRGRVKLPEAPPTDPFSEFEDRTVN